MKIKEMFMVGIALVFFIGTVGYIYADSQPQHGDPNLIVLHTIDGIAHPCYFIEGKGINCEGVEDGVVLNSQCIGDNCFIYQENGGLENDN